MIDTFKCTGCQICGAELDERAGDDVDLGLCPECKYQSGDVK